MTTPPPIYIKLCLPSILLMLELCISGQALRIFLLSSLAHTMNAFIGRFICGLAGSGLSLGERMILAPNILPVIYNTNVKRNIITTKFNIYMFLA